MPYKDWLLEAAEEDGMMKQEQEDHEEQARQKLARLLEAQYEKETITLAELLKNSDTIPPANLIVDKNNCLGDWRAELQNASDKIKFDKCQEQVHT